MKKQIIFIDGGETFDSYEDYLGYLRGCEFDPEKVRGKRWKDSLAERLGEDFEVIAPTMPCKFNAKYKEWKIWFDRVVPFLRDGVILIGHSLGGIFLAKYLSENDFPKKISATYLIAAPYDAEDSEYSLADFTLPKSLEKLRQQGGKIFIFHSEDDPVVPFLDSGKYLRALPEAEKMIFKDKGHFLQEEFPELVESVTKMTGNRTGKKSLKFQEHLASLVLSGEKTITWRFFDDKDLRVGDEVNLINANTKEIFGSAKLTEIREKPFGEIKDEDFDGHEKFESEEKMYEAYKKYYGDKVNKDTTVKIIKFRLEK